MRKSLALVVTLVTLVSGVTASAQEMSSKDHATFEAFSRKIAEEKAKSSIKDGGEKKISASYGVPQAAAVAAALEEEDLSGAVDSPLGLAAGLPVKTPGAATLGTGLPTSPEDLQARMDAEASDQMTALERETFDMAVQQLMPMKTEQIRELYELFITHRRAAETPIRIPETRSRVQVISLEPDSIPPVIHMAPGYVTTVSILDSSGAPWPIQDLSYAGDFTVAAPENGGHLMRITAQSAHGVGNMSLRLVDLITPIIFTLTTDIETVDYRYEARLTKPGPLAKTPIIEYGGLNTVAGTDSNLVAVLDGALPAGAERLRVRGADPRTAAWRMGGRVYLRTPLSLLSPAWDSSVSSSDGTTVYTMNDTPVVLLSDQGRMVRAHITAADEVSP